MVSVYCIKAGAGASIRRFGSMSKAIKFARMVNRTRTYARVVA